MFIKCYLPVSDGEQSRASLVKIKALKDQADAARRAAEAKVKELGENLKKAKEDSEKALAEAKVSEEAAVKAVNDLLEIEQRKVEQSATTLTQSEEARRKLEVEIIDLKKQAETTAEENSKKLEEEKVAAFEEGVSAFLYTTWLQHPEMDFSFLGTRYFVQVTEWIADAADQRADNAGFSIPQDDPLSQDPPADDPSS